MRWRLLLLGLLLAGCAGSGQTELSLGMYDNFFSSDVLRIPAAGTVDFVNEGKSPHNATAVEGAWATRELVGPGERAAITVDEPGVYDFYCTLHGETMNATLVVGDVEYEPADDQGEPLPVVAEASGGTRRVPDDHTTIQAAVDAAAPGDLVLIGPGVYAEEVKVTTPSLTLRGTDRNAVIVDGEFTRANGISVTADGVAVENLTVRNAKINGLYWTAVQGYRASYVTAYNNEVYGIYAYDAVDGLFEHSYASGSYDAGFYIGQCDPCDAVITDVVAEHNGLGYSGTNASGNLHIVNSVWRDNVAGIVPNTLDSELLPPVERVHIAGNLVVRSGSRTAPVAALEWGSYGNGIIVAGGNEHLVERNLIVDSPNHGILVTPNLDKRFWTSSGNVIRDNVIRGSGRADIALSGPAGAGNCFAGNDLAGPTIPVGLQAFAGCDGMRLPLRMDLSTTLQSLGYVAEAGTGAIPDNPSAAAPVPPPQPQMPDAAVRPAVDVYAPPAPVRLPQTDLEPTIAKGPTVFGLPVVGTSVWQVLFGLYGYLLPFVLYAAWTSLALWDLARRDDLSRGATIAWIVAVLVIPFLGVIAYHVAGRSPSLPGWLRAAVVGGGIASYLLVLAIGALLGGIV